MRKFYIILTGILFTLLFATCKQFTTDIDDYLGYWSSEAFIRSSTIDKKTYNDANGMASVASADKVTVTLKIQNPKSFRFVMPPASKPKKIVEFAHFAGPKPEANIDYKLTQPSADTLKLVYNKSFLEKAEWGEKDISSTITLYADDGREFKQTFTIPLKANTPPPKPRCAVVQTTGSPAYYVLCITVPDMNKTAGAGKLLHTDLAYVEISSTSYAFSVDEAAHTFIKPEADAFITRTEVKKLTDPDADSIPSGNWVLFYRTNVEVKDGAAKKDYTIKLIDKKGLASDIVNASTKPNKPEAEEITPSKGTKLSGNGGSATDPIIIGTNGDKAEIRITSATANTTVHCTLTESGSSTPAKYDGNPVTVPLPLNSGSEKQYKLEYYTDGTGFVPTEQKTVYYKVVKAYTVTYRVEIVNGEAGGTIKAGSTGEKTSGTVSVAHGASVTFTAEPTNTDWKVAEWSSNVGNISFDKKQATLSNVTADTTVTVKLYQSEIDGTAPMAWRALLNAVKDAPAGATLTIRGTIQATNHGSGDNANYGKITIDKDLTIKGEGGAGILDANQLSPIFIVQHNKTFTLDHRTLKNGKKEGAPQYTGSTGCGVYTYGTFNMQDSTITNCEAMGDGGGVYVTSGGTCIMKNSTITGCTATENGGGVCVSGGSFKMQGSSTITGCTASKGGGVYVSSGTFEMHGSSAIAECSAKNSGGGVHVKDGTFKMSGSAVVTPKADTAGKHENDVYLESRKIITVDGTLSNNPAARITPESYTENTPVLRGNITDGSPQNRKKFTVPPEKVTEDSENWNVFWYIADNGNLKAEVEDPDMLKTVTDGSPNNTIIKLGNISDLKTVEIWGYRKIMLKADRAVTLTCSSKGNNYKHLQVQEHASLILKGPITLQGTDYGSDTQYALYVENGGKAEIKDGVTITGFKNGNIGPVVSDGKLTMSGGEISGNKAKNGGGVYIHASWRSFKMTGGTIKGNLATEHGGGVYVDGSYNDGYPIRGQFWLEGGTIEGNTADKGGGVYSQGEFTMSGGTITKNTATNNGRAIMLNYYFHWDGGEIKGNLGNGSVVGDSGGNFSNNTNPRKEPS